MKKVILSIALVAFLFSCNSETEKKADKKVEKKEKSEEEKQLQEANKVDEMSDDVQEIGDNTKDAKPSGPIYRCDGFHNGIVSEWLQVQYDEKHTTVKNIWYWDVKNEEKVKLIIHKITAEDGPEITGFTGKVSFPGQEEKLGLGIIEDKVNLIHSGDRMQQFEFED